MVGRYFEKLTKGARHGHHFTGDILKVLASNRGGISAKEFRTELATYIALHYFQRCHPDSPMTTHRFGAEVMAIQCSPTKMRNLTMVDPFRKVAALHFIEMSRPSFAPAFKGTQYGAGCSNGSDKLHNCMRTAFEIGHFALGFSVM